MDGKSYDKGRGVPFVPDLYLAFEQLDDTVGNVDASAPTFLLQKPQAIFFRDEVRTADLSTGQLPFSYVRMERVPHAWEWPWWHCLEGYPGSVPGEGGST